MTEFSGGRACGRKAEGKIAYAKRSHHAGKILFDESNAFDGSLAESTNSTSPVAR